MRMLHRGMFIDWQVSIEFVPASPGLYSIVERLDGALRPRSCALRYLRRIHLLHVADIEQPSPLEVVPIGVRNHVYRALLIHITIVLRQQCFPCRSLAL